VGCLLEIRTGRGGEKRRREEEEEKRREKRWGDWNDREERGKNEGRMREG
jgi:hypothetical protein